MTSYGKILAGQGLMAACCAVYLIWWSICYKPGTNVQKIGGINGLLLFVTVALGVSGFVLSLKGAAGLPSDGTRVNGLWLALAGLALYFILMFITVKFFNRIVTTELALITGWGVLEVYILSAMKAGGVMKTSVSAVMMVLVVAAFVLSMVLYVMYYRMEPVSAYHAAMIPLISEGTCMLMLVLLQLFAGA
jgi:hypothetical protein